MSGLKRFGAICAAPVVVFCGTLIMGAISPGLALVWVLAVAALSLIARRRALPSFGLISGGVANAALVGALLSVINLIAMYHAADRDRLAALAASDPEAYLAEIRKSDERRWLNELKRLDPDGYQVEIDRRENERRQEIERRENERRQEIAALEEEVRGIPASEYERNLRIYERLAKLAPDERRYAEKVTYYRQKDLEVTRQRQHPEEFVRIVNFSWRKTAYDSIMEASFIFIPLRVVL
jgi:hypothetical protein